jgi:hypothetical protein
MLQTTESYKSGEGVISYNPEVRKQKQNFAFHKPGKDSRVNSDSIRGIISSIQFRIVCLLPENIKIKTHKTIII